MTVTIVADPSVLVLVSFFNHLLDLIFRQLLPDVAHDEPHLIRGDVAVVVLIEHAEGFPDFLFGVRVLHLFGHHV